MSTRYPKYQTLPAALGLYFLAMMGYGIYHNNGHLPDHFLLIVAIEAAILVALFFALRYLHRKQQERE